MCSHISALPEWLRNQHAANALQDSSTSGANVKRLDSESTAAVKNIEKSIASKKKEVRH